MEAQIENKRLCCKLDDLAEKVFWPTQIVGGIGALTSIAAEELLGTNSGLYQLGDRAFDVGLLGFAATIALYAGSSIASLFYKRR